MTLKTLVVGRLATLAGEYGFGWAEAIGISGGQVTVAGRYVDVEPPAGPSSRRPTYAVIENNFASSATGVVSVGVGPPTPDTCCDRYVSRPREAAVH